MLLMQFYGSVLYEDVLLKNYFTLVFIDFSHGR